MPASIVLELSEHAFGHTNTNDNRGKASGWPEGRRKATMRRPHKPAIVVIGIGNCGDDEHGLIC